MTTEVTDSGTPTPYHIKAEIPDRRFFEHREFFLRHLMSELVSHARRGQGQPPTCLDIGCNEGRYTAMLASLGMSPQGVDISSNLLREARSTHPGLVFEEGDAAHLRYGSGIFDCVVSLGLIQMLPDWRAAIAEMIRVLRPGGVALIETNRTFPLWEALIKSLSYFARPGFGLRRARSFLLGHWRGSRLHLDQGLRSFSIRDLLQTLEPLPIAGITIHDPRKRWLFHDFMWAMTVTKADPRMEKHGAPDVNWCRRCRRRGVVRTGEPRRQEIL